MHRLGHYGVALALYAPVGFALMWVAPALAVLCGAGAVALSTLPDVDHWLPGVAHRGPTHSVAFMAAVAGGLALVGWTAADGALPARLGFAALGAAVGAIAVGSHLLADWLTPMGVRPFWPVSDAHYSLSVTRAADPVANWVLLGAGAVVAAAALALAGAGNGTPGG